MADIIRNAIIRLAIEQGETVLKAPDMSRILEARKEEIRLSREMRAQAANTSTAQVNYFAAIEQAQMRVIAREHEMATARQHAAEEAATASARQLDDLARTLGAAEQVADGFFLMARASALLGAKSDEDLRKILATLMKIQGAFDLFKGASATFRGFAETLKIAREGQIALGLATEATTLAQAAQIAMTAKLRTALTLLAAHPVIAALAALTVVVFGVIKAYEYLTDTTEKDAAAQDRLTARIEKQRKVREATVRAEIASITRRQQAAAKLRAFQGDEAEVGLLGGQGNKAKLAALSKEQALVQAIHFTSERGLEQQKQKLEIIAAKRNAIMANMERESTLKQKMLQQDQARLEKQKAAITQQAQSLKLAQDALRAEESRVQSVEARFGALNKHEQAEVKRIAKRLKMGTATLSDAARGQQLAPELLGKESEALQAKAGQAAGFAGIRPGFYGEQEKLRSAEAAKRGRFMKTTGGKTEDDALAGIDIANQGFKDKFKTFLDDNLGLLEDTIRRQDLLTRTVDDIGIEITKGAAS